MPIRKFTTTYSPVALYNFNRNLRDDSGNGLHLPGTATFRHIWPNIVGIVTGSPTRTVFDPLLAITGDVTIQVIAVQRAVASNAQILSFSGVGETEATNALYQLDLESQSVLQWFSESVAGVNADYTVSDGQMALPALGVPFVLQARRQSNVITFFLNGIPYATASAPLVAPTGGTAAVLSLRTGTNPPELASVKINNFALTDQQLLDEYMWAMGDEYGPPAVAVESLWVGALTDEGVTVSAKLTLNCSKVRLAVTGPSGTIYSSYAASTGQVVKIAITGLDADTAYTYQIEAYGGLVGTLGNFKTAPTGNASFTIALSGDGETATNAAVFSQIKSISPLLFLHMGDMHYTNISTNNQSLFHAAFDTVFSQGRQASLYQNVPTAYVWDDHDYGPNNADGSSASHNAACAVYRERVPHYPLAESAVTGTVAQSFTIGRVLFLMTDQRSAASPRLATDNSSKTMLGTTQKAWFKDQIANNPDKLIVWVCPRVFGVVPQVDADNWGGFTTERTELVTHIHANAPGRVVVLSADLHLMGIDNGAGTDFLPGGGEPLKVFQCAPLDKVPIVMGSYISLNEGAVSVNGVYGTMEVVDTGGSSVDVIWKGFNSSGTQLLSYSFTVNL